jgi:hypothetical protein
MLALHKLRSAGVASEPLVSERARWTRVGVGLNSIHLSRHFPRLAMREVCCAISIVTISLTDVLLTDNIKARINLAHVKDVSRVTAAGGASAVPADGGSSLLFPGGSGISLPAL